MCLEAEMEKEAFSVGKESIKSSTRFNLKSWHKRGGVIGGYGTGENGSILCEVCL